jgi:RimJ/RimL family protein N-acetyltransferase
MLVGFRPYSMSDRDRLASLADNPRVAANLRDSFPHPYTRRDAEEWIQYNLGLPEQENFALTVDGVLAGGIGLMRRQDVYRRSAEVGYWLGEDYWGRGIASEALRQFCTWTFDNFELHRLYAGVFSSNPASCRVLEKAGFSLEGRLRESVFKRGQLLDELVYGRLRSDQPPRDEL